MWATETLAWLLVLRVRKRDTRCATVRLLYPLRYPLTTVRDITIIGRVSFAAGRRCSRRCQSETVKRFVRSRGGAWGELFPLERGSETREACCFFLPSATSGFRIDPICARPAPRGSTLRHQNMATVIVLFLLSIDRMRPISHLMTDWVLMRKHFIIYGRASWRKNSACWAVTGACWNKKRLFWVYVENCLSLGVCA